MNDGAVWCPVQGAPIIVRMLGVEIAPDYLHSAQYRLLPASLRSPRVREERIQTGKEKLPQGRWELNRTRFRGRGFGEKPIMPR